MVMLILQIVVLLGAIVIGIRLGGIVIGYAGGLGVVILCLGLNMSPGDIPWDVILIIMSVISAIAAMQLAGGLDYMVIVAEKILRKNPKYINYLAPFVTYFLTILAGTGHTAFSMIPVIVEVAKEQNIKPSAPLSISVVSSQIAITASPVSAAVVFMSGILEPFGWSYPTLLLIWLFTTFSACMITAFIVSHFFNLNLSEDKVYRERLKNGLIKNNTLNEKKELSKHAKLSVVIFLVGVFCVVFYATTISDVVRKPMLNYVNSLIDRNFDESLEILKKEALESLPLSNVDYETKIAINDVIKNYSVVDSKAFMEVVLEKINISQLGSDISDVLNKMDSDITNMKNKFMNDGFNEGTISILARFVKSYIDPVRLPRDGAIICFMLAIATFIIILCRVDSSKLSDASTFKAGMTACICVLGVAWLGNTFVAGYTEEIKNLASKFVGNYPWLLSVALFFVSTLLYSQAATAKAIIPVVVSALGISAGNMENSYVLVASFAAVSALFVLPTYPTLLGAIQMDDTGTTRVGKYIFNHSFIIPGVLTIFFAVLLGFFVSRLIA